MKHWKLMEPNLTTRKKNNADILREFIEKCHNNLISGQDSESQNAMEYLQLRGLTKETILYHKIGFCYSNENLDDGIRYYGNELLVLAPGEEKRDISYFLKGRIIVPVFDEFGIPVGLGSRKPTYNKGESWWNMPAPFYKGRHLFLLDKAKKSIFETGKVYLVEGYMDALYLFQQGLTNVVCIMGTSLSDRKIGLIARYCDNVCICFDMDANESGQEASMKAICRIRKFNFCESISTIVGIPVGVDPDEFVQKNGLDSFLSKEHDLSSEEIKKMGELLQELMQKRKEDARSNIRKTQ